MFQATQFAYEPAVAVLPDSGPPPGPGATETPCVGVYVHAEPDDAVQGSKLVTKAAKNVKWLANKTGLRCVVLHSFDHLSELKATPEEAHSLIDALRVRLEGNGYEVMTTPFGYSCAWSLSVMGEPIAKVFKAL